MNRPESVTEQRDCEQTWLVQRRLPGAQGANGCWNDQGVFEAVSAADAVRLAVGGHDQSYVESGTYWRAAIAPEWEQFTPRIQRHTTVTINV